MHAATNTSGELPGKLVQSHSSISTLEQVRQTWMKLDESTEGAEALLLFIFGLAVKRNTACGVDAGLKSPQSFIFFFQSLTYILDINLKQYLQ